MTPIERTIKKQKYEHLYSILHNMYILTTITSIFCIREHDTNYPVE